MNFTSIKWRLLASYIAVALLAALALGSLMLLVLNGYYARQERAFLLSNAETARTVVEQSLQSSQPDQALKGQVVGLAFLLQAEIKVLDDRGRVLVDSGIPDASQSVVLSGDPQGAAMFSVGSASDLTVGTGQGSDKSLAATPGISTQVVKGTVVPSSGVEPGSFFSSLPVSSSPLGFGLSSAQPASTRRSAQAVSVPLLNHPGSLEISHGPAYGAEVLHSVTLAWLAASLVAVILAGLAGILASRQVTKPLLALTDAARRMQFGDLSSRATLRGGRQAREFSTLAETFNQMAQRVEDTISTLRAFVSDAAHEINNPLTALHTNLELAINESDARQRELFLGRAVEQEARLERLAGGLLDLSRLEAGPAVSNFASVDLVSLAAEIGEHFAARAEQGERSFTQELLAAPLNVMGNAAQLQRMIDNLLENALKFTPPGGTIHLNLERADHQAVLCVADSGIGILPEDLPQLFERFHRGRNAADYPGTGLGLAIVKAITELHGGQVEVQSPGRGQGSRFCVRLPLESLNLTRL